MLDYQEEDSIIQRVMLRDAIRRLPDKQKVVLLLRAVGYTQEECGLILGVTRQAIGFTHKQAIRNMQSLVQADYGAA